MEHAKEMQAAKTKKQADETPVAEEQVHTVQRQQRGRPSQGFVSNRECYRCGNTNHTAHRCRFKDARCFGCGKVGHVSRVCRSKKGQAVQTVSEQVVLEESVDETLEYPLHAVTTQTNTTPITAEVSVDEKILCMEVDTGAAVSVLSETTYKRLWPEKILRPTTMKLKTYSGSPLTVLGQLQVQVKYQDQAANLPIIVIAGDGPSLLGRDWLAHLKLDWKRICHIRTKALEDVLLKHPQIFQEGLGTLKGHKATLHVDTNASPVFCKPRQVPYAMRKLVNDELVLAKHVDGSGTTVSPAEEKCEMEVVSCGRRGISFGQGTSDVVTGTGALRPTARHSHGV